MYVGFGSRLLRRIGIAHTRYGIYVRIPSFVLAFWFGAWCLSSAKRFVFMVTCNEWMNVDLFQRVYCCRTVQSTSNYKYCFSTYDTYEKARKRAKYVTVQYEYAFYHFRITYMFTKRQPYLIPVCRTVGNRVRKCFGIIYPWYMYSLYPCSRYMSLISLPWFFSVWFFSVSLSVTTEFASP